MAKRERRAGMGGCVVCGTTDARTLSSTRLRDGERVVVCGSHKMAHRRSDAIARTVAELRALTGERRSA